MSDVYEQLQTTAAAHKAVAEQRHADMQEVLAEVEQLRKKYGELMSLYFEIVLTVPEARRKAYEIIDRERPA